MNQTNRNKNEEKEERIKRIINKAYQDACKLKYGRVTIFIQDGHAFRVETTDSYTGKPA